LGTGCVSLKGRVPRHAAATCGGTPTGSRAYDLRMQWEDLHWAVVALASQAPTHRRGLPRGPKTSYSHQKNKKQNGKPENRLQSSKNTKPEIQREWEGATQGSPGSFKCRFLFFCDCGWFFGLEAQRRPTVIKKQIQHVKPENMLQSSKNKKTKKQREWEGVCPPPILSELLFFVF